VTKTMKQDGSLQPGRRGDGKRLVLPGKRGEINGIHSNLDFVDTFFRGKDFADRQKPGKKKKGGKAKKELMDPSFEELNNKILI